MKRIKIPLGWQWMLYRIQNYFKMSTMPRQLKRVADDPAPLPEYQRQVKFLKEHDIKKPYDCLQCRKFDIEIDVCRTPYAELYCGNKRGDRMCPGFDPPKKGKFEFVINSVDDLV